MKKRIIGVCTALLITASASVCSAETVKANVADHRINMNGHIVFNRMIEYPFMEYSGVTYCPMTTDNLEMLGLGMQWSPTTGANIYVDKEGSEFIMPKLRSELLKTEGITEMKVADFRIELNGEVIDNSKEEYPILFHNDIIYFPLTWRFVTGEFEGTTTWNNEFGLSVYNHQNSGYTKDEIRKINQNLYMQDALSRYEATLEIYETSKPGYDELKDLLKSSTSTVEKYDEKLENMKTDSIERIESEEKNMSKQEK